MADRRPSLRDCAQPLGGLACSLWLEVVFGPTLDFLAIFRAYDIAFKVFEEFMLIGTVLGALWII